MTDPQPLSDDLLQRMDAWWRAANYLNIGQIYLLDNPLLRAPLRVEHIKPRLLGHWGTSPGLNLVYVHLNRLINQYDANVIYMAGPGHGGPALVANVYLEGTYSEFFPTITPDEVGLCRLFRQFSTPGGIPSHVSAPTPGSIHEGGELGYVLVHAFGAAFDNPDLVVVAVVGDGEAETGPLEGSWKGVKFLNPKRDGAVLPILHLNGYKIAGPTVLGRESDANIAALLQGHGYDARFVEGDDPPVVHRQFAIALESAYLRIRAIQDDARRNGFRERPVWPAIVLRTPKGWTGPKVVDGEPVEGTFRAHQVPLATVRENPAHLRMLEEWLHSYRPEELFDDGGRFRAEYASLAPRGARRMGANPHANGGVLSEPLDLPAYQDYAVAVPTPATERLESTRVLGTYLRLDPATFESLFGLDLPVVFAFHGYPGVVHQLIHGRPDTDRFHVRGYVEEGTTTTPFDMVVLNHMSRIDLAHAAVQYSPPRPAGRQAALFARADEMLARHRAYVMEHFEDLPEIRDWTWS